MTATPQDPGSPGPAPQGPIPPQPVPVHPTAGIVLPAGQIVFPSLGAYIGFGSTPGPYTGAPGFTDDIYEPAMAEVHGARWWWLYEHHGQPALTGMRGNWTPGNNQARCMQGYGHDVPCKECGCGFWAYWQGRETPPDTGWWVPPVYTPGVFADTGLPRIYYPVAGVIQAWGRIRAGVHGFRAQHAKITALAAQAEPAVLEILARMHPDAQVYRRTAELYAEHPTVNPWAKPPEKEGATDG